MDVIETIVIVIPTLDPDDRLIELLQNLKRRGFYKIVLVNDGSGIEYDRYFEIAEKQLGCIVLKHAVNLGKGRALKDAFNFILSSYENIVGVITADSDGQHTVDCIEKCGIALMENPDSLILGVRNFDDNNVPWKSELGNKITRKVCNFICGIDVSDTQTGLRGISKDFMRELLSVSGERFEFETQMLIATKNFCKIKEIPIKTIYDSKKNHSSHFDPIKDSLKIYKIFGTIFFKYIFSSLSSSVIDLLLFAIFSNLLVGWKTLYYITYATIFSRIISSLYNYIINYKFVFFSKKGKRVAGAYYFILVIIQMILSALLVTVGVQIFNFLPIMIVKISVDTILFFLSYHVQQRYIF